MYREGVEPDFDMLRHMYSLNKKKGELAFSLVAVPSLNIFARLKDLPKTWRHRYFIIKHPSEFCSIRRLWVDECHKIKRPQLPSVYSELAIKLHQCYLTEETSASNFPIIMSRECTLGIELMMVIQRYFLASTFPFICRWMIIYYLRAAYQFQMPSP